MRLLNDVIVQSLISLMSCLIIKSYLNDSFVKRNIKYPVDLLWILYFFLNLYCEKNNDITLPKIFIAMTGVLLISSLIYEGAIHRKLAAVFLYYFVWIAIEMLLGYLIMGMTNPNDYANFELLCSILSKIIMLAVVKMLHLFVDPWVECNRISRYCFMLTVLPLISIFVVYNIFLITSKNVTDKLIAFSAISSLLILFLNLLVYDIYIKLLEQIEKETKKAIYEKQISLFQEQMKETEKSMLNDQIIKQKYKYQLSIIKELVYKKEWIRLNNFIDSIIENGDNSKKTTFSNSGNILLDCIINSKCTKALTNNVECKIKIEVPYKFPFQDGDIYIIVGNALDNAIEGTLKLQSGRFMNVNITYRKETLFIKIENSFDGNVKRDRHGKLLSTKPNSTRYGTGIDSMEKAVDKYNGLVTADINENIFTLTVLLYS